MPGMNSGLNPADPTIVAAFRSALVHQWVIVLAPGPGGALDALAVSGGSALTVFRLTPAGAWQQTQVISVPVQLGSSS